MSSQRPFHARRDGLATGSWRASARVAMCLFAGALALTGSDVRAANVTWSGAVGTAFATGSNWVGNVQPANNASTDIAVFGSSVTANQPNNAAGRSVGGLVFQSGTGGWLFSGNTAVVLNVGTAGLNDSANTSGTTTISANLTASLAGGWAQVSTGAGGKLLLSGTVTGGSSSRSFNLNVGSGGLVEFSKTLALATTGSGGGLSFTGTGDLLISGVVTDSVSTATYSGLTLANAGLTRLTGTSTYTGATTISGGTVRIGGAGMLGSGSYAGAISISAGKALEYASSATQQLSGTISGAGDLRLTTGAGTLVLSGSNTYSGTTAINAGALIISSTGALPGWNTAGRWSAGSGGTLAVANGVDDTAVSTLLGTGNFGAGSALGFDTSAGDRTYAALAGSVGLTKLGANTLTLSASNSFTGTTTIAGGTLALGNANALAGGGNVTFAGGVLQYGASNAVDYSARIRNSGSAIAIDTNGQSVTFASALDSTNTGGLTKLGGNSLTLSGSNAYAGATTISGGTLTINGSGVLGSGSYANAISIASGATLNYASSAGQQLTGAISGPGGMRVAGTGVVTLSGANTFSGGIAVTSGTLLFGAANSIGSNLVDINGGGLGTSVTSNVSITSGSFRFSQDFAASVFPAGQLTINVPVTLANGTRTINISSGAGFNLYGGIGDDGNGYGLIRTGGALLRLGGTNTYTGDTRSDGGTISVWTEFALQNSAVDVDGAGSFVWNQSATYVIGGLKGSSNFTPSSTNGTLSSLRVNPGAGVSKVYSGALANTSNSGTLGIIMIGSGTQVFSGANTYTGTTEIRAGTLQIGNSGTTGKLSLSSAITGSAGGTLAFNRTNTVQQGTDFNSVIGGGLGVSQFGAGTLELNGVNGYTGATTIRAGRLHVSGGTINSSSGVTINGGEFKYNSSTALTAPITFTQGTISGTGTIATAVTVATNDVLSPGNSPGIQNYTSGLTWASGGSYLWEINDWTGSAGTAYDQVAVTGAPLDITATSGSTYTITITSLSGTAAGAVANWSNTSKTFTIATALSGGGVTGFDAANFSLNTTQFTAQNPSATGSWSISATGSTVLLNYSAASATTYTLAAAAGASAIHVGGTTSISATVTNTGTGSADSLAVAGLGVTVSPSGSVSISPASGTAANGNGTVLGSGNFTPVSSGSYSFTPSVASATNVTLGGAATATGTTSASVTAWAYAAANSITGTVNFGAILAGGTFAGQSLSISNLAANDGFSEKLDAAFGTPTGSASGSGSISLLSAGGTSTAMSISLAGGSAGSATGSVPVNFTSNGLGTSGLGTTTLAPQTVFLSGTVLDPAVASFAAGPGATTSILLSFGTVSQYSSPTPLGFDLYNLMQTNGFTADLALLQILSGTGNTGDITTTLATFNNLAAGSSNGYTASLATTTIGSFENIYTLQFKSANGGTAYSGDSTQSLTLTVQGFVVVPEPGALAVAGIGVFVAGAEMLRRRRRRASTPA